MLYYLRVNRQGGDGSRQVDGGGWGSALCALCSCLAQTRESEMHGILTDVMVRSRLVERKGMVCFALSASAEPGLVCFLGRSGCGKQALPVRRNTLRLTGIWG
jgi:hypothetical protein